MMWRRAKRRGSQPDRSPPRSPNSPKPKESPMPANEGSESSAVTAEPPNMGTTRSSALPSGSLYPSVDLIDTPELSIPWQTQLQNEESMVITQLPRRPSPPVNTPSTHQPPLFGRPSKNSSLEEDLPDVVRKQEEQHSTFGSVAKSSLLVDDIDDDDDENHPHHPAFPPAITKPYIAPPGQFGLAGANIPSESTHYSYSDDSSSEGLAAAVVPRVATHNHQKSTLDTTATVCPDFTPAEIEQIKDYARTLCDLTSQENDELEFLENMLTLCKEAQQRVTSAIENSLARDDKMDLKEIFQLHDNLEQSIHLGEMKIDGSRKKPADKTHHVDVKTLVENEDIFSLICTLRAQHNDKRLEAALALMKFARDAEQLGGLERIRLRNEICSSGGMVSLLSLFRTPGINYELKIVVALAVAYILPSFVDSGPNTAPDEGLKIVNCLRALSRARKITPNGEVITESECCKAAAKGIFLFWMNQLLPLLESDKLGSKPEEGSDTVSALSRTSSSGAGRIRSRSIVAFFDQRRESIELQELVEMTVSLIVYIAKCAEDAAMQTDDSLLACRLTSVEQVCAIEVARPIAVREGILAILVSWIKSKDPEKIPPATSALRNLTSIKDRYMAGWIHSQMVNEGALLSIVSLTNELNQGLSPDVQLTVSQILCSLCVAPHTRAAVVEAQVIFLLIQFLCGHREQVSQESALFAGRAIIQLATGAITRANVFGDDDFENPVDKRDDVIQNIIEGGAIEAFVEIALTHTEKLRTVAIEALRVLSEDASEIRQTRNQLCYQGAANALGVTLKDNLEKYGDLLQESSGPGFLRRDVFAELHEALRALSNILDPLPDTSSSRQHILRLSSDGRDTPHLLMSSCMETTESGGLEALLCLASLVFVSPGGILSPQRVSLLQESCRSLASISPVLLSKSFVEKGYSIWADEVLKSLFKVVKQLKISTVLDLIGDSAYELQVNIFRALGALAMCDPLKVRIIDRVLPYIVQANSVRDGSEVSDWANHAFQSLGFAEDEVAVQVAGTNPQLLADWICLERSCLIQAMVRKEIKQIVQDTWAEPLAQTHHHSVTRLFREASDYSIDEDIASYFDLFDNFADDSGSELERESILEQYRSMYDSENVLHTPLLDRIKTGDSDESAQESLLDSQVYPLHSSETETDWILSHDSTLSYVRQGVALSSPSRHVEQMLNRCFPSRLLQNYVVPMFGLSPRSSFNFRAFMMPQKRRYFSFRREGQLLSRLCAKQGCSSDPYDVHWTICFTNSSFAGDFAESLVQALYLCPMIHCLSFSNVSDSRATSSNSMNGKPGEDGAILANLSGSLPPWIACVTFDGVLGDRDVRSLVTILETMGKLSPSHEPTLSQNDGKTAQHRQGNFCFLGIRRSPDVKKSTWKSFFALLGAATASSETTLSRLKILDLSGNKLGDELCARILELAHSKDSGCRLEQLDLSENCIRTGSYVLKVLRSYVEQNRYNQIAGRASKPGWKSCLHTLFLAKNDLHVDKTWLELIILLKHNALELKSLDLSSNGIILEESEIEFVTVLTSSLLKNSCLQFLNLSRNKFSSVSIDHILSDLAGSSTDSVLSFLLLESNSPALTSSQRQLLSSLTFRSRKVLLQRCIHERNSDESLPSEPQAPTATEDEDSLFDPHPTHWKSHNMITVLFSAPLVYYDSANVRRPFAKLDFSLERELMWQCLKEASRDIDLSFDNATHDRLQAAITKRCSCLHYSGHGHHHFLPFENKGGADWFSVKKIKEMITDEGGTCFRFVFVSACHSENAGRTFAEAGVPHVICCQQTSELKDAAAISFTRAFYLALAVGNTVKESFDRGCKAVRATPNLRNADKEMEKFKLLPENGNHNTPIFDAKPIAQWPRMISENSKTSSRKAMYLGGTRASELSVRNMMQEDPSPSPPQFFLGREDEMFQVLTEILRVRLVSVIGEAGIGRSSLVCALCHYINERASTIIEIEHIYFVKAKHGSRGNRTRALMRRLIQRLKDEDKLLEDIHPDTDYEEMSDAICRALKNDKALIVFNSVDLLEDSEEANEIPRLISTLLEETRNVRVLLTNRKTLGSPRLVEKAIELGPLQFANTVRLFANICPYLNTPKERRKLFQSLVRDGAEENLLPTDPGLGPSVTKIFSMLGGGIPSQIIKAAYGISKEDYLSILTGSIREEVVPLEVRELG